jgi:hypothetical protein
VDLVSLPKETLEEKLYFSEADLVSLPEETLEERSYLNTIDIEVSSNKEIFINSDNLSNNYIGEIYLDECLQENFFPEGY